MNPPKLAIAIILSVLIATVIFYFRRAVKPHGIEAENTQRILDESEAVIKRLEEFTSNAPAKLANHRTEKDKEFRFNAIVLAYAGFHMATNGKSWLNASNAAAWRYSHDSLQKRKLMHLIRLLRQSPKLLVQHRIR